MLQNGISGVNKRLTTGRNGTLQRTAFCTSRLLDFATRKDLIAQTGHQPDAWPLVALKELTDNAVDACEDARVPPEIQVHVDKDGIEVRDNGPGIPPDVVDGVLDFSVRVSTREAYVSPTRGAQGNALKTIVAMPFVLDGEQGRVTIDARGVLHDITMRVDRIRQALVLDRRQGPGRVKTGTAVRVYWPKVCMHTLESSASRFLQIARGYTLLNPHLSLRLDGFGEKVVVRATAPDWPKWLPGDPTSPHWYGREHFERLVSAYIGHDRDTGRQRTVRELVSEFRGFSGSAKQKAVLDAVDMTRLPLDALADGDRLDTDQVAQLLTAMKQHSKPVKPALLGILGRNHLATRFENLGAEMESFEYRKVEGETDGIPWVVETAFAWCPRATSRRLVTGVNWSPGIVNLFRELGRFESLYSVLERHRAGSQEPVIVLLHVACPRVEHTDRGKSAVIIGGSYNGEE
jgi:DNA topoisomerase VI subunit B